MKGVGVIWNIPEVKEGLNRNIWKIRTTNPEGQRKSEACLPGNTQDVLYGQIFGCLPSCSVM